MSQSICPCTNIVAQYSSKHTARSPVQYACAGVFRRRRAEVAAQNLERSPRIEHSVLVSSQAKCTIGNSSKQKLIKYKETVLIGIVMAN